MKTTAAVVHEVGKPLVRYTHAGLCHSDLHVLNGEIAGSAAMRGCGRWRTT